ncbi:MAG: PilW family protein [Pseudomonadota bacterium]
MAGKHSSRGFSIVELMVGMVIAILSSIVVFQVFSVSERQKRTTTGAADAQSNGAIAHYMLDRDIKMAGWGLVNSATASCSTFYSYYDDGTDTGPVNNFFASIVITDGGANPDSVTIQYYEDPADANLRFSLTTLRSTMPQSSSELNVNSTYGCGEGDLAIVVQGGSCTLMEITQVQDQALKLQHNPGGTPSYNPSAAYQNANGWPAYSTGATMQCFSKMFRRTYRIQDSSLELQQPDADDVTQTYQVTPNIVDMQVEYGIAPVGSQQVNEWQAATGAWAAPVLADVRRIKAVRLALVARSAEYEKPDPGSSCTTTTTESMASWSTWASFDASSYGADWQCYRYKVFETVIPLRNIIWSNV